MPNDTHIEKMPETLGQILNFARKNGVTGGAKIMLGSLLDKFNKLKRFSDTTPINLEIMVELGNFHIEQNAKKPALTNIPESVIKHYANLDVDKLAKEHLVATFMYLDEKKGEHLVFQKIRNDGDIYYYLVRNDSFGQVQIYLSDIAAILADDPYIEAVDLKTASYRILEGETVVVEEAPRDIRNSDQN